jgi:hypothetical protein
MRKSIILCLIIIILFWSQDGKSQQPGAFQSSNYGGLLSTYWQPAQLADNRIETEFFLGGFQVDIWNNHLGLATSLLWSSRLWDSLDRPSGLDRFLSKKFNDQDKMLLGEASLLGPGIMITSPRGPGFAVYSRFRNNISVRNVNELLLQESYGQRDFDKQDDFNLSLSTASFLELGASTGFIIHEDKQYILKAGFGVKYLSGFAGFSFHSEQANLRVIDTTTISFSDVNM